MYPTPVVDLLRAPFEASRLHAPKAFVNVFVTNLYLLPERRLHGVEHDAPGKARYRERLVSGSHGQVLGGRPREFR